MALRRPGCRSVVTIRDCVSARRVGIDNVLDRVATVVGPCPRVLAVERLDPETVVVHTMQNSDVACS